MKDSTFYIAHARALVGENCKDGSFQNDIVKVYNAKSGYWYDGEGCSETAAVVGIKSGNKAICPMKNWAQGQISQAKQMGIYSTDFVSVPCLMYVSTAKNGNVDHTTVVIGRDGGKLYTVEGNLGATKAVKKRSWSITDKNIICFATPKFTGKVNTELIKAFQKAAIADGHNLLADGVYGAYTQAIVKKAAIKKGTKGNICKWLQQFLYELGYYHDYMDGECGAYTEAAVKAFQKAEGLTADGWCGQYMLKHILID